MLTAVTYAMLGALGCYTGVTVSLADIRPHTSGLNTRRFVLVIDNHRKQDLVFATTGSLGFDSFLDAEVVDVAGKRVTEPWHFARIQSPYSREPRVCKVVKAGGTELYLDSPFWHTPSGPPDELPAGVYRIRYSVSLPPNGPAVRTNWLTVRVTEKDVVSYKRLREQQEAERDEWYRKPAAKPPR